MGTAWDTYGNIFAAANITEAQFINAVKNKKSSIVPLVQNKKLSETNRQKVVALINDIIDSVGSANAGGYDALSRKHGLPESQVEDLDRAFVETVIAMHENGDLD